MENERVHFGTKEASKLNEDSESAKKLRLHHDKKSGSRTSESKLKQKHRANRKNENTGNGLGSSKFYNKSNDENEDKYTGNPRGKDKGDNSEKYTAKSRINEESERIQFGTAEVPKLAKNSIELDKVRRKQSRLYHGLKYEIVFGNGKNGKNTNEIRKRGLFREKRTGLKVSNIEQGRSKLRHIKKIKSPLNFVEEETNRKKLEEGTYKGLIRYYDKQQIKNQMKRRSAYRTGKSLFDNENIAEDEVMSDLKSEVKKNYYGTRLTVKGNIRNIQNLNNRYRRIAFAKEKEWLLQEQRKNILNKGMRADYKQQISSASSQIQKRRLKKEMASAIRNAEGSFVRRNLHQVKVKAKTVNRIRRSVKRVLSTVLSIGSLLIIFLAMLCVGFIIILGLVEGVAEYNAVAVTQNDYGVLSEATGYLKKLETDLEEYLIDKEELEEELQETYGPQLYEFHYSFAELGFSNNTLMAYLSAKYGSFKLEQVMDEIEELFAAMYEFKVEVKEEIREIEDTTQIDPETGEHPIVPMWKKICYVTLEKIELETVVENRMNSEEREKYDIYTLSRGGQQVYGPVMKEDWTNLISSDYGERIHPITGERTFHNGIDIAIPTGTPLYSAVKGTVILAQYSESAGNYMKVQTESGWTVTFMHMDSIGVQVGQQLEKGDFVGNSGNTGLSTGPHLHLEVRDADGNTINPYFIVPQNCYEIVNAEE